MDGTERARGRRSFTPQFKAETVDICRRGDRSIAQVARDYGLSESTVRAWVKQADIDAGLRSDGPTTAAKKERAALRRKQRRTRELRWRLVMGITPIVIGCVLVVIGTVSLLGTTRFLARAGASDGIVVNFVEHSITTRNLQGKLQASTEFCPVVRFATPQSGATTQFEADDCSPARAFRLGQSVRIFYDQRNPTDARLDTWSSLWGSTLLLPLGLLFMAVGVGILYPGLRDIRSVRPPPLREGPTSNRISEPEITE
jgi:transposase